MNKVELPMNSQPFVRSNVSRASLFSILTSEEYAGKMNAIISLQSLFLEKENCLCDLYKEFERKSHNAELLFDKGNKTLKISSNPYQENKYAYLLKKVDIRQNFCFEIKVDYIQDSNALSLVKLVLSNGFENNDKQNIDSPTFFARKRRREFGNDKARVN